jgi:hypothetical protein
LERTADIEAEGGGDKGATAPSLDTLAGIYRHGDGGEARADSEENAADDKMRDAKGGSDDSGPEDLEDVTWRRAVRGVPSADLDTDSPR